MTRVAAALHPAVVQLVLVVLQEVFVHCCDEVANLWRDEGREGGMDRWRDRGREGWRDEGWRGRLNLNGQWVSDYLQQHLLVWFITACSHFCDELADLLSKLLTGVCGELQYELPYSLTRLTLPMTKLHCMSRNGSVQLTQVITVSKHTFLCPSQWLRSPFHPFTSSITLCLTTGK